MNKLYNKNKKFAPQNKQQKKLIPKNKKNVKNLKFMLVKQNILLYNK